jgi:MFS family permease
MKFSKVVLFIIFLVFIALGLPDALLGSSWNESRLEFGVEIGAIGFFSFASYLSILFATFIGPHVLMVIKTQRILFFSVLGMGLTLVVISQVSAFWMLLLLAIPLGLGSGLIDISLQHYVASHLKASHMNFLHSSYGIGVTTGPFLMANALAFFSWREGYIWIGLVLIAVALGVLLSFRWWPDHAQKHTPPEPSSTVQETLKTAGVKNSILIFLVTVHVESMMGVFMASYAFIVLGLSASVSALATTTFFVGFTVIRLISGALGDTFHPSAWVQGGQKGLFLGAILLGLSPWLPELSFVSFFVLGVSMGPIYPNMMQMNKERFGTKKLSRVMSLQMVIGYTGFGILTPLVGQWFERVSMASLPYFIFVLAFILMALTRVYVKPLKIS